MVDVIDICSLDKRDQYASRNHMYSWTAGVDPEKGGGRVAKRQGERLNLKIFVVYFSYKRTQT